MNFSIAYADDVIIIAKLVFSWAKDNGLGVNATKTELALFTRRLKIRHIGKACGLKPNLKHKIDLDFSQTRPILTYASIAC